MKKPYKPVEEKLIVANELLYFGIAEPELIGTMMAAVVVLSVILL